MRGVDFSRAQKWRRLWERSNVPGLVLILMLCFCAVSSDISHQLVIGVDLDPSDPRAYPLEVLNYHEIVNDVIQGKHVAITWSPLTFSNILLHTDSLLLPKTLGTTGKVYQNNLVSYDRATHTYWSQLGAYSLQGPLLGTKLSRGYSMLTYWATWKKLYPHTRVLNRPAGSTKNYLADPYKGYRASERLLFESCFESHRTESPYRLKTAKEETLVVFTPRGNAHLFPVSEVTVIQNIEDLDEDSFIVIWDQKNKYTAAYSRLLNGTRLTFYNAGTTSPIPGEIQLPIIRDRYSGSVWNASGTCISGPLRGTQLTKLVSFSTYWSAATSFFPKSQIWKDNTTFQYFPVSCPPPSTNPSCAVPCKTIIAAGPSIDGIKSIDQPTFMTPAEYESINRVPKKTITAYSLILSGFIGLAILMHGYYLFNRYKSAPSVVVPLINNANSGPNPVEPPPLTAMVLKEDDEAEPELPPETPVPLEQTPPQPRKRRRNKKHARSTSLIDESTDSVPMDAINHPLTSRRHESKRFSTPLNPIPRLSMQPWQPSVTSLNEVRKSDLIPRSARTTEMVNIPRNKSESYLGDLTMANNSPPDDSMSNDSSRDSSKISLPRVVLPETQQYFETTPSLIHRPSNSKLPSSSEPKSGFDVALEQSKDYSVSVDSGSADSYMISLSSVQSEEDNDMVESILSKAALNRIKSGMKKSPSVTAKQVFSTITESSEENNEEKKDHIALDF